MDASASAVALNPGGRNARGPTMHQCKQVLVGHFGFKQMANKTAMEERLLTPKEAANFLSISVSWLAKARMRGDGPTFIKVGRSIRYAETVLIQWTKSQQRLSTSERYTRVNPSRTEMPGGTRSRA
jgi:predicted DNA-binding transcriptional regulator AlpA